MRFIPLFIFISLLTLSCNHKESLQSYIVNHQEQSGFITQDLNVNMLKINVDSLTPVQKDAYQSIKRLNILGYKIDSTKTQNYLSEVEKVKTILGNPEYNELSDINIHGTKFVVKYLGNDTSAKEVVVFGNSDKHGFIIARVLGDKMSPDKALILMKLIKKSKNTSIPELKSIIDFYN